MAFKERQFVTVKLKNRTEEQSYIDCTFEIVNGKQIRIETVPINDELPDVVFIAHIDSVEYCFLEWRMFQKEE